MHYITGTSFVVKTVSTAYDRQFKTNSVYHLVNIYLQNEKVKYTFKCAAPKDTVEVIFESCRAADTFIATHRRERIPNYEKEAESEDAPI
jgi:hypothetical protein